VWSDNLLDLYEEAVSRQWSATRDIPWGDLPELDPDIEHAMCQLATVLSEVEMVASDFPAKWLWRINHDYVEAKMLHCTQVMDEARHTEVFRKRALANGGGLGRASAVVERFLQLILDAQSCDEGSALMHLLGEGIVLSLFRAGEAIAPSPVEQQVFRLCMQDEARHEACGSILWREPGGEWGCSSCRRPVTRAPITLRVPRCARRPGSPPRPTEEAGNRSTRARRACPTPAAPARRRIAPMARPQATTPWCAPMRVTATTAGTSPAFDQRWRVPFWM
jgi:hypothetical protein